ncbi:hypothetical protein H8356DRAFT_1360825 [Neocallimastix lanati (nom. inval.)]|nr:hypothetical protein H8356DRAFT_1360825 [Neocallimastix sp. JGI-2020a]
MVIGRRINSSELESIKDSDINKIYEVGIYGLSIFELLKQNKFYQNYSNFSVSAVKNESDEKGEEAYEYDVNDRKFNGFIMAVFKCFTFIFIVKNHLVTIKTPYMKNKNNRINTYLEAGSYSNIRSE